MSRTRVLMCGMAVLCLALACAGCGEEGGEPASRDRRPRGASGRGAGRAESDGSADRLTPLQITRCGCWVR